MTGCKAAGAPRYRALAGKKGIAECQRRGTSLRCCRGLSLRRLKLHGESSKTAAADVVVAQDSAKSYDTEAAKTAGWAAARVEQTTRTRFRKDVPDHAAFKFVPFAVETCGYMDKEAVKFVNRLGDIARICYMEKTPNAWHRQGTHKRGNTYNQPNQPNQHTSQTKHQALSKGQPGRRITPMNTAAVHGSAHQ